MSDTDSFIEEVTEEVRRDRLFAWVKRYGWIVICVVLLTVGAAAFYEYRKAQSTAQAQAFGDNVLAALDSNAAEERALALAGIETGADGSASVLGLLRAKELFEAGNIADAKAALQQVSDDSTAPLVYRQVATFKLLALQTDDLSVEERSAGYQALIGGNPQLGVLAEEQLALLDIEQGKTKEAIAALSSIVQDAEATAGLKRRATQLIIALGGELTDVLVE